MNVTDYQLSSMVFPILAETADVVPRRHGVSDSTSKGKVNDFLQLFWDYGKSSHLCR